MRRRHWLVERSEIKASTDAGFGFRAIERIGWLYGRLTARRYITLRVIVLPRFGVGR